MSNHDTGEPKTKDQTATGQLLLRFGLACLFCLGLVTALVLIVQSFAS